VCRVCAFSISVSFRTWTASADRLLRDPRVRGHQRLEPVPRHHQHGGRVFHGFGGGRVAAAVEERQVPDAAARPLDAQRQLAAAGVGLVHLDGAGEYHEQAAAPLPLLEQHFAAAEDARASGRGDLRDHRLRQRFQVQDAAQCGVSVEQSASPVTKVIAPSWVGEVPFPGPRPSGSS
jgi:hypothetical protein